MTNFLAPLSLLKRKRRYKPKYVALIHSDLFTLIAHIVPPYLHRTHMQLIPLYVLYQTSAVFWSTYTIFLAN